MTPSPGRPSGDHAVGNVLRPGHARPGPARRGRDACAAAHRPEPTHQTPAMAFLRGPRPQHPIQGCGSSGNSPGRRLANGGGPVHRGLGAAKSILVGSTVPLCGSRRGAGDGSSPARPSDGPGAPRACTARHVLAAQTSLPGSGPFPGPRPSGDWRRAIYHLPDITGQPSLREVVRDPPGSTAR